MGVFYSAIFFLFLGLSGAYAQTPDTVRLDIRHLYSIENGFDTNDRIEVSAQVILPDTCHQLDKGYARVDEENKKIYVRVEGYVKEGAVCLPVVSTFLEVIRVGYLQEGQYTVLAEDQPDVKPGIMSVRPFSQEDQDDYLYAPVDAASLSVNHDLRTNTYNLTLEGTYPLMLDGCMRLQKIKSYLTSGDILIVQPVSEILANHQCNPNDVDSYNRFKVVQPLELPELKKGLLHVRTLNGRSLNKFIDFTPNHQPGKDNP